MSVKLTAESSTSDKPITYYSIFVFLTSVLKLCWLGNIHWVYSSELCGVCDSLWQKWFTDNNTATQKKKCGEKNRQDLTKKRPSANHL